MLMSWHNFFYVSFDPAGFVSIDKPPLGFWIQSLSTSLLGFYGWALILPQAISGIISTVMIYLIVKKYSGRIAAILSALFFCVTPISIATNRNNTIDSLIVLTSLLAVWALMQAVKTRKALWLFICMIFIGLGFNIKMSQAYIILPACLTIYIINNHSMKEKISSLFVSGIVLVVISFTWMAIVDLTPIDKRPYVGGSQTNSAFELAINYNGISRWVGLPDLESSMTNLEPGQVVDGILPDETGYPGAFRLFNRQLAGQISWLLPVSVLSLIFLYLPSLKDKISILEKQLFIFLAIWLLTGVVFFSFGAFFHRHYLIMVAPPISILAGVGLAKSLSLFRRRNWQGWLFPFFVITTIITSILIVFPFSTWNSWILPSVILFSLLSLLGLIIYRLCQINRFVVPAHFTKISIGFSFLCLIFPQLIWCGIPVIMGGNGALPFAGPDVLTWNRQPIDIDIRDLINSVIQTNQGEKYYLGTLDYDPAEWIILKTGKPVLTIGGFYGTDPILSTDEIAKMVKAGEVRLFFVYEKTAHELRPDLLDWFHKNCIAKYSVTSQREEYFQLYDCSEK